MSEVQQNTITQESMGRRNPVVTAYLLIAFATPFSSGSPWHVLFALCWFLLFIAIAFIQTRKSSLSLTGQLKDYHPAAWYLLLAFGIASLVSYLLVMSGEASAQQKIYATIRYITYLIVTAYVFALARFCLVNNLPHSKIFFGYMLGGIVLVFLLLLIYFLGDAPNAAAWAINPPIGEHVRLMGMIASVSLLVAVIFFLLGNKHSYLFQALLLFCLLISAAFLIWTGSRASMGLSIITILLIAGMGKINGVIKLYKVVMIIICLALSVVLADKFSIFEWNGLHRAVNVSTVDDSVFLSGESTQSDVNDKLTTGRINMWSITLETIKQKPWFGLGPYGYFFIPERPNVFDHPHNLVLQFLTEWGVIGAGLLLALLAYLAWHGCRHIAPAFRARDIDYIISASVVFILTLTGLVDGTYFLSQPLFCLATAFAVFPFFTSKRRASFISSRQQMK
jgi:O-antigen ligase